MSERDDEANNLAGRLARYARVGAGIGGIAARRAGARAFGRDADRAGDAAELARILGGLKGPLMKVAQLAATVPDVLPPEYAFELQKLQAAAPEMGAAFVRRRMRTELGPEWAKCFKSFENKPAAAASLGQVHRAVGHDGRALACKLQYPNMQSAVEADLSQLSVLLAVQRRFSPEIDTREILAELRERLREELDYEREAGHMRLYGAILADTPDVAVPEMLPELSTGRLLTMTWLQGAPLLSFVDHSLEDRNRIATRALQGVVAALRALRRHPRRPASRQLYDLREGWRPGRAQSPRLWLHPHLPAALRRRRDQSLSRLSDQRP